MAAILKRALRFLPTRSIPVLLGALVLSGCTFVESECGQQMFGPGAKYNPKLDIIEVPPSAPDKVFEWQMQQNWNQLQQMMQMQIQTQLSTPITPVDQGSVSQARGAGSNAIAGTRSATSTASIVYVLDKFGGLLKFDPASHTFVGTLDFSQLISQVIAQRLAITPDSKFAFITANSTAAGSAGYVLVADLTKFSIAATIPMPTGMHVVGIAIAPDGSLAYAVTQPLSGNGASNVYVINVATRQITTTIPIPGYSNLGQIAIAPDGTVAYLINDIANSGFSIPVIDLLTNTVQPSLPVYPSYLQSYMALHPDGTRIYLAPLAGGPVQVVNTVTGATTPITLPQGSGSVFGSVPTFTPDGLHLVLTSGSTSVVLINTITDTVESTITLPPPSFGEIPNTTMFFVPSP